ncbi:MAG: transposase, partial [Bacteroidetes bacterium]|nr:transposase [Bacteroidota bacterium]
MPKPSLRKHLSASGLLKTIRHQFNKIDDPRPRANISVADCLMSGLAIFGLKYPSLLKFEQDKETVESNLHALYGNKHIPSDTYLRERLDEVDPTLLRKAFTQVFAELQRGKGLE